MRVLHVMPTLEASAGGSVESLKAYLAASRSVGIATAIVAPRPAVSEQSRISDYVSEGAITFKSLSRGAAIIAPGLLLWLARHAKEFDIVHVHGLLNPMSSGAARIAILKDIPLVIRPFGTMSRFTATYRRSAIKELYMRVVDRPNLSRAAVIHFTSTAEQAEAAWHGVDVQARGRVVPPCYVGEFSGGDAGREPRTALFLGRIHPVKNLEALIDAWARVLPRVPDAQLIIAGAGDAAYEQQLEQRVGTLGLSASVSFTGFADAVQKERLLNRAGVLVLPSHHENFGMSAVEGLAHGIPVVVSTGVHLSAFVREHNVGYVTESDPLQLGNAIVSAMTDQVFRNKCKIDGPAIVRKQLSPEAIGVRLRELYQDASGGMPARNST